VDERRSEWIDLGSSFVEIVIEGNHVSREGEKIEGDSYCLQLQWGNIKYFTCVQRSNEDDWIFEYRNSEVTEHWHKTTCRHDETADKTSHEFENGSCKI